MPWNPGDRLTHRFNPELGPGMVLAVHDRKVVVVFPRTGERLSLAADNDALEPLDFPAGARALLDPDEEPVRVAEMLDDGRARLDDGRVVAVADLWPAESEGELIERLATGEIDKLDDAALRWDALHLATMREADGLGSFVGGRIRIFPHQFHAAERATAADPVRWLLADEVGLGKTVEACLILNHLLRTGRADRTLVLAPRTLTVQWLGELWRKYHQVFVLLDDKRLNDVERDYGKGFNPFDAHHRVVLDMEMLVDNPWLGEAAAESGIDLLIVDEAHHLRRRPGHPGNPDYRAVAPLAAASPHVLLLTATPLEDDAHGFFRLLQLLRPEEFPEGAPLEARLERGEPLPPCTSATRRDDIGGLPPRQPCPIDLAEDGAWAEWFELEQALRGFATANALERQRKAERLRRLLAGPEALAASLGRADAALRERIESLAEVDPRLRWLAERARGWRDAGDKTLVFVADRSSLEAIRAGLSRLAQLRTGVFHEDLSPGQRDIEVAQFRLARGPSLLISTECGGEGRNFEFCTRLVLFDLPWEPMAVEQRIGRLDRIGRDRPVEIVYFRPPAGLGRAVTQLYEKLGTFERPLGSFERELAGVAPAIAALACDPRATPDEAWFETLVAEARAAYSRVREAAYHELHRDPYRPELADSIVARIPAELEELTEEVVLQACERLHLTAEPQRGVGRYALGLSNRARVDSLPGVPAGSSFLGTFEREEALRDESIDFYASGHPFVEGVMTHLEEAPLGRVALLQLSGRGEEGVGLLAWYRDGARYGAVAVDGTGRERPEWAALIAQRPLRARRIKPEAWTGRPEWPELIRGLAARLPADRGTPAAVAFFHLSP